MFFLFYFAFLKTAMACPDLAGVWTCVRTDGQATISSTITQNEIPNGTYYAVSDSSGTNELYADGVSRPYNVDPWVGTEVASCVSDTDVEVKMGAADGDTQISVDEHLVRTGAQTMSIRTVAIQTVSSGQASATNADADCTLNSAPL